jgi:DNA-binding SARP family transcriptional activator
MATLRLDLFGGFALEPAGRMAKAPKKVKALLAYLALHPGVAHPRAKLASLLWEANDDSQARQSLRQALADLRKALPEAQAILLATTDSVTLRSGRIEVDVLELDLLHASGEPAALERAIALYRGDILEGLDTRTPAFEEWLSLESNRAREQALGAMTKLLQHYVSTAATEPGVRIALRLLALDPLRESAHRWLMQLLAQQGRYGAALKQYQTCRAVLARELGVAPEASTRALHDDIAQSRKSATKPIVLHARPEEASAAPPSHAPDPADAAGTELVPVSVLGIRLVDSAALADRRDPEALRERLHRCYEVVDAETHALGGLVARRASDVAISVFGLPRGDRRDVERAARAAVAIHRSIAPLEVGIGLATGKVLRSGAGGDGHEEPALISHCVASAAHLAHAAQAGQTIVADEAYQDLATQFDGAPLSVDAPAQTDEARAWVLGVERPAAERRFVGRDLERRLLASALEACRATGCGQSFLIRGEAGIGKSRLIEELEALARAQGFATYKTLVLDFGAGLGQDAVRSLARNLLELPWACPAAETEGAVARACATGVVERSSHAFLTDLLGLSLPARSRATFDAMAPELREAGRQSTLAQLIESAASRHPSILVVEDIHWADATTLTRLAGIARSVANCAAVLVKSSRSEAEPLDPAWRGAMLGAPLTTIDLGPLRDAEAMELAAGIDGKEEFVRRCVQRAEGNPFILEQLLRATDSAPDYVPHSVQSLVCARLDRLPDEDKQALRAAAVMGQRFLLAALRHLLASPRYACDRLLHHGLIRPWAEHYLFAHALIAEAVYESLPKSERKRWHRAAADWFGERDLVLCAEHLDRAAERTAAHAYLRAARAQAAEYRNSDALRLVRRGLALDPDATDWHELVCLEAELLQESGAIDESIAAYERSSERATGASERCRAWIGIAAGLRVRDRYREALEVLERAQRAATRPDERALIHFHRGNVMVPLGRTDDCLAEHKLALQYSREADSPMLEARALSGLGDAYYLLGRMQSSYEHFTRCIELCRKHGLGRIEVANLAMRGATRFYFLELAGAIEDVRDALDLAVRVGNRRAEAIARNVLAYLLDYAGEHEEARDAAKSGLDLAHALGSKRFEVKSLLNLGLASIGLGRRDVAESTLDEAYAIAEQSHIDLWTPWVLGALACAAAGDEKRRWALSRGEALLAKGSVGHSHLHFYQLALEATLADRQWDEVERYAELLERFTSAEPLAWSTFFVARARALTPSRRGREDAQSCGTLERLVEQARQAGLKQSLTALESALASTRG